VFICQVCAGSQINTKKIGPAEARLICRGGVGQARRCHIAETSPFKSHIGHALAMVRLRGLAARAGMVDRLIHFSPSQMLQSGPRCTPMGKGLSPSGNIHRYASVLDEERHSRGVRV
jgi:hypothetical protein